MTSETRLSDESIAGMVRALGHPVRISILRTLARRECSCGEIVEGFPLAQSTVSQHLKVLRDAGWITGTIDGPRTCYALDPEAVGDLRSVLAPMLEEWEAGTRCSTDVGCC